jgi:hypothetical protein
MKTYIYNGPSGYNPDLGQIANGQDIRLSEKEYKKHQKFLSDKPKKKSKQESGD